MREILVPPDPNRAKTLRFLAVKLLGLLGLGLKASVPSGWNCRAHRIMAEGFGSLAAQ